MSSDANSNAGSSFITRWKNSAAAERANYQLFLSELCELLEMPRPEPAQADDEQNAYVFERAVTFHNGDGSTSTGRIDLYRRGCFVLEAKQGSKRTAEAIPLFDGVAAAAPADRRRGRRGTAVRGTRGWDVAMREARGQAEQYVRALPPEEGNPPFIIVTDVGYSIELYSDFSRAGKTYVPFPDSRNHRILIDDLEREEIRERLRLVWADPMALDPSRQSARVTRNMAERLAALARSLEADGHSPERVAHFLMRVIFTAFAEDMRLLPERGWTDLLESLRGEADKFPAMVSSLWETMNAGGFSPILRETLLRFNGSLFEGVEALPITREQLELLVEASRLDWKDVEPAIFGTLLERALNPRERHMLGAHYTPRAYVERLVMPTVIEPLREEWEATLAAAVTLDDSGRGEEAANTVKEFHRKLCRVRVLDPACGTGNFLYVTLEHLKRLEGEVLDALHGFGERQGILEDAGMSVDPHQLLGIEKNPRAVAIADLVLWIGYLQWHFRTRGDAIPPEPVLKRFHNIEERDAVLAYDAIEIVTDEAGQTVTRWDGRTLKKHTVTGEDVPDETARVPLKRYVNPRPSEWPEASFIVGNPPFIGKGTDMREALGEGYVEALRATYPDVPDSSDYVMYWWDKAAELARTNNVRRFGFITTNSIKQTLNRRVVERHLKAHRPLSLLFAIPDHPWVDSANGAAVRISMTVGAAGENVGRLLTVTNEARSFTDERYVELEEREGKIYADLKVGVDMASATSLLSNSKVSNLGVSLHGLGFLVTAEEAEQLGLGRIEGLEQYIRNYRNGRDLTRISRNLMVIDLYGLGINEVRNRFPEVYQWVYERVKPERDQNPRRSRRENWWLFADSHAELRGMLHGLSHYIVTVETAKHRFFSFLDQSILPDHRLIAFALDDAFHLGVLSSNIHLTWALAAGGTLEDRPVYNKTRCFEPFPFPDCTEQQKARIRELGEALDAHRKRQEVQHPSLTLTEMYNVLEKLRAGEPLSERERTTHEQGLVSILRQIHDELDAAVADAYGWPPALSDEEILERLVRLNAERAAEERTGLVRWLRPEYQKPAVGVAAGFGEGFEAATPGKAKEKKQEWPKTLPEQARALRQMLATQTGVITPEQLAKKFMRARVDRVKELLQTLVSLGQAREVEAGRFAA
jgi:hypothetical protein